MPDEYSLYEAKAKLSALVRQVREGRSVIITVHGQPAAELRPIDPSSRTPSLAERLAQLDGQGAIRRAPSAPGAPDAFVTGPRKAGALKRFLDDRG